MPTQNKFTLFSSILLVISLSFNSSGITEELNYQQYNLEEIINSGHHFFAETSGGLATILKNLFSKYGLPNAYILGEEGSGAFFFGLTYGEGIIHTKNLGTQKIFWQGPSFGWDFGGRGSRVMILVYNLNSVFNLFERYGGISGSAYLIAGLSFDLLKRGTLVLVPIHTGVGARVGINIGYLKFSAIPTWNPF
ncbi:MAG: hypothetical protein JSC161_000279 [Candidatus Tokpelaia sp. JSC161]|jgi:hypothetical protein|nr:MAG: hypothetical protein JSC161_000279 [Candidatus Tokpelaia sp. JSC161]